MVVIRDLGAPVGPELHGGAEGFIGVDWLWWCVMRGEPVEIPGQGLPLAEEKRAGQPRHRVTFLVPVPIVDLRRGGNPVKQRSADHDAFGSGEGEQNRPAI